MIPDDKRQIVEVGDSVLRHPIIFSDSTDKSKRKMIRGTVIYVHPKKRYHVVEFGFPRGNIRESFHGDGSYT